MNRMAGPQVDLEAWWQRYGTLVLRRCRFLLRDEDEALDVTQDVFVELLRRQDSLDVQFPVSFVYRVATNLCLNRIRDRRRRPESLEEAGIDEIASLSDTESIVHAASLLRRVFSRHLPSTRLMATMHFVDGLTLQEVAEEVHMSVSGVRKRLRGLRATLAELEAS